MYISSMVGRAVGGSVIVSWSRLLGIASSVMILALLPRAQLRENATVHKSVTWGEHPTLSIQKMGAVLIVWVGEFWDHLRSNRSLPEIKWFGVRSPVNDWSRVRSRISMSVR